VFLQANLIQDAYGKTVFRKQKNASFNVSTDQAWMLATAANCNAKMTGRH
jgi:hypothetical protein